MRSITECEHCGQSDDHPKVHYGVQTYHHDCTPAKVKQEILDGAVHNPNGNDAASVLAQVFSAAENGVRGSELVAHIEKLHAGVSNG